jgi:glycosyltransferase involved in cell wall biosynthesis
MHVLVNAASAKMGGAVTYLFNLLRALSAHPAPHRYTVYVPAETLERLAGGGLGGGERIRLRPFPSASTSGARRLYFDQVTIPRLVRREGFDALVSATGFGTLRKACPEVLLVRNALLFEAGGGGAGTRFRRWWTRRSLAAADVVVFPTAALREAAGSALPPDARAEVLPFGFDPHLFRPGGEASPLAARMRGWRAAGETLLLNVSSYAVHKGFETVVEALPAVLAAGHRVRFVTTLSEEATGDRAEYAALLARIHALGLTGRVVAGGYLPHAELAEVYRAAHLFVFPSRVESFGHPMLEAMASALPVVASDTPVHREVCGAAALYFPVGDAPGCAAALQRALEEPALREGMAERGLARAAQLTWPAYAARLTTILEGLAGEHRRPS